METYFFYIFEFIYKFHRIPAGYLEIGLIWKLCMGHSLQSTITHEPINMSSMGNLQIGHQSKAFVPKAQQQQHQQQQQQQQQPAAQLPAKACQAFNQKDIMSLLA